MHHSQHKGCSRARARPASLFSTFSPKCTRQGELKRVSVCSFSILWAMWDYNSCLRWPLCNGFMHQWKQLPQGSRQDSMIQMAWTYGFCDPLEFSKSLLRFWSAWWPQSPDHRTPVQHRDLFNATKEFQGDQGNAIRCNSLFFILRMVQSGDWSNPASWSGLYFFKGALNRTCEQTQQTHRLWSHLHVFDLAWCLCLRCPAHKAIAQIKGQKPFLSTPAASLSTWKRTAVIHEVCQRQQALIRCIEDISEFSICPYCDQKADMAWDQRW